ncbi:putative pyridoxal kinase C6F6.11c [Purpureocillium lavendulum]|uniref:Pyridoxal kinase C6F6.11c n=1 Tax=Purpureocillium lavendulum TaxID=1247861 RepID=A0AB34G306_9HYPO|nr:putative pyridoxal kinase C6F6.11c [Purpureocillium lavendulum]
MDTGEHSRRVHSATGGLRLARGDSDVLWEEDASVRQAQLARGAEVKLIASRAALCTLQSVSKDDLPKNEQICVICYNEYNEMSPEGVSEAPLRLPRCKHVFGDHCIKKWFEESDSCPYCRDKLPSEPKTHQATARAFMNIMRLRGVSTGELDSSLYRAITSGSMTEAQVSAYLDSMRPRGPVAERRSPPNDTTGQDQRRTRRRRRSPSPRGALGGASTRDEVSVRPTDGAALGSDDVSRASASYTGHTLALLQYEQVLNARRRHLNSTTGGDTAGAEQVQAGMPPMEGLRSVATWDSSQHGSQ